MLPEDDEERPPLTEPPPDWFSTPCYSQEQHLQRLRAGKIPGYPDINEYRRQWQRKPNMIRHRAAIPPMVRLGIITAISNGVNPPVAFEAAGVSRCVLVNVIALAEAGDEESVTFYDAIREAMAGFQQSATQTIAKAIIGYDEVTRTKTSRKVHKKAKNDKGETVYALLPDPEVIETETSTHKFDPDLALKSLERLDREYWGPGFLKYLDRLTPEERVRVALGELAELGVLSPSPALPAGSAAESGDSGDPVCEAEWQRCSADD